MSKARRAVRDELEQGLFALTMEHLTKLASYIPGPVKKRGTRDNLLAAYQHDPVFSIFGLDSMEYLAANKLDRMARQRVSSFCQTEVAKLTSHPKIDLVGVGMEVRHCYQTGDSKRSQADEALARHFLLSGILPVMPLFCNQSNPGIVSRYRSVWVIKQGMEAYDMVKTFSGYDFFDFLWRNRDAFRKPVIKLLRSLTK